MDMDGPHRYEINLKTGDLTIDLASDDVYFISKQMDKWFRILLDDSYVPVALAPPAPAPAPQPEPSVQQQIPAQPVPQQPEPAAEPEPTTVEVSMQPEVALQATSQVITPPQTVDLPMAQTQSVPPQPEAASEPAAAPAAPPVVQFLDQPSIPSQPAPQPPASDIAGDLQGDVQDDFEAVMDSLMKDLESDPASAQGMAFVGSNPGTYSDEEHYHPDFVPQKREPHGVEFVGTNPGTYSEDHYHVESGSLPAASAKKVDLSTIDSLDELCENSRASSAEDYLLMAAYYLTYFDGQEKFSLKKVNSLLVKSGLTPVNHSILESALSGGRLSMVPDMTGTADVTEYTLTEEGQQYANDLL